MLAASYPLLHNLLMLPANMVWHPPAGLRFALLMLLPMRWWLPMTIGLELWYRLLGTGGEWRGLAASAAHFVAICSGPWLLRQRGALTLADTRSWCWLFVAMMLSATCNALQITLWPPAWVADMPATELLLRITLGDYVGMMLMVPLIFIAFPHRPSTVHFRSWRADVPRLLLPLLVVTALVLLYTPQPWTYLFAAGLCLPIAIHMALRSGWRGVTLSIGSVSLLIGLVAWHRQDLPETIEGQLLLALVGTTLLLLGAASESQRAAQHELRRRNEELHALTGALREAAQRNLDLSEDVRRWVTAELHDELGQNLTALQTRLVLLERRTPTGGLLQPAWEIIGNMRHSVSSLMSSLRPAGLDEFGLVSTLGNGAIRTLLEEGDLSYHLHVLDHDKQLGRLDDRTQTSLYRITQEAATNAIRHAQARNFMVRIRSTSSGRISLLIGDDGSGFPTAPRQGGLGLQGIRDRVLSLGGTLRLRSDNRGTWLLVRLQTS